MVPRVDTTDILSCREFVLKQPSYRNRRRMQWLRQNRFAPFIRNARVDCTILKHFGVANHCMLLLAKAGVVVWIYHALLPIESEHLADHGCAFLRPLHEVFVAQRQCTAFDPHTGQERSDVCIRVCPHALTMLEVP
eukprot:5647915-Prymnesium_polylepis.2